MLFLASRIKLILIPIFKDVMSSVLQFKSVDPLGPISHTGFEWIGYAYWLLLDWE